MRFSGRLRVLELYCGIGGCAAALGDAAQRITAVDINRVALGVYSYNFSHRVIPAAAESIPIDRLRRWNADLWWMSPPCQPFTRRGLSRDIEDPRAATFLAMLSRLARVRPPYVACENVPPFRGSRAHGRLIATLERAGYSDVREFQLCPTELGMPNRRLRYYLVAGRDRLLPPRSPQRDAIELRRFLDPHPSPQLAVDPDLAGRYRGALHVVRAEDPNAVAHCFTSAYGRSPVRSGSYLDCGCGIRRFSPSEILRLLGFPTSYRLPGGLPLEKGWRLVANSLSIVAVRQVLAVVPELGGESSQRTSTTADR